MRQRQHLRISILQQMHQALRAEDHGALRDDLDVMNTELGLETSSSTSGLTALSRETRIRWAESTFVPPITLDEFPGTWPHDVLGAMPRACNATPPLAAQRTGPEALGAVVQTLPVQVQYASHGHASAITNAPPLERGHARYVGCALRTRGVGLSGCSFLRATLAKMAALQAA